MLLANSARRNHKPNQKSENRAEKKPPNRKVCTKCYTSLSILHIVAVSFWTAVVVPKFGNELETRVRDIRNQFLMTYTSINPYLYLYLYLTHLYYLKNIVFYFKDRLAH